MSSAKQLFLHVGTHKTGSSSFQASLEANHAALVAQGVYPMNFPLPTRGKRTKVRYNMGRFAQTFLRPEVATIGRLRWGDEIVRRDAEARIRPRVEEEIRRHAEPRMVLSAEAFTFLRTPDEAAQVRAFLAGTGRDVTVLLVERNMDDWRAAWRNQVNRFPESAGANAALPDERRADGAWYFDREAIAAFWAAQGTLRRIDYDAVMAAEGSILPALYRAFGVDPAGLALDFTKNARVQIDEAP